MGRTKNSLGMIRPLKGAVTPQSSVMSTKEEAVDARVEEERQIRAALVECFSILQEWSRTKLEE